MYQVLARKYRPRNFAELVGQEHVAQALSNALTRGRLHHAYLFTGTRGVGKTTIARILSKCLNCETGITATPCDVCATCTAINQGRFIDLIEIDAASRTKVEDTRELLDNVPYAPTQGRYKVYLIDEVHMLSTHSFNALLKTLEEPPEHVKFLLATTDPQKLPITVLSRCLQFTLRPLPQQSIHDHLAHVLNLEKISSDDRALWQLAEAAQGSLRDALSLTDQAIAYGQGSVQGQDVQDMLGLLDKSQVIYLLQAINQYNAAHVSQILANLANQAVDLKAVLDQLVSLLHQVALVQLLPDVAVQGTVEYQQQIKQLAQQIQATDLQLYYQIALQGRQDLKHAVSLQQGFDMCILRLLAFRPLPKQAVIVPSDTAPAPSDEPTPIEVAPPSPVQATMAPRQQPDAADAPEQAAPATQQHDPNPTHTQVSEQPDVSHDIAHEPSMSEVEPPPIDDLASAAYVMDDAGMQHEAAQVQAMVEDYAVTQTDEITYDQAAQSQTVHPAIALDDMPSAPDDFVPADDDMYVDMAEQPVRLETDNNLAPEPALEQFDERDRSPVHNQENTNNPTAPPHHIQDTAVLPSTPEQALLPQHILRHTHVVLEGEWSVEKWECWLREADISHAVRNLAQHGIMKGTINAQAQFMIAPAHQLMATELMASMVSALQQQWPNMQIELVFQTEREQTPLQRKAIRQEKALQQAEKLLAQEPLVTAMMQTMGAQLQQVQLKDDAV